MCPSDRLSIQSRVGPTDSLSNHTETQNKDCVESYICYIHSHYKETNTACYNVNNLQHLQQNRSFKVEERNYTYIYIWIHV